MYILNLKEYNKISLNILSFRYFSNFEKFILFVSCM